MEIGGIDGWTDCSVMYLSDCIVHYGKENIGEVSSPIQI